MPVPQSLILATEALQIQDIALRLGVAAAMGFLLGLGRERLHKAAGLRTHVLVALGSAVFVLAALGANATVDSSTRVIQGITQGIGFLGAGTILKMSDRAEVRGLTTAASVWLTAAIGVAAALGDYRLTLIGTLIAWFVLGPLNRIQNMLFKSNGGDPDRGKIEPEEGEK